MTGTNRRKRLVRQHPHLSIRMARVPHCWPVCDTILELIETAPTPGIFRPDPAVDGYVPLSVHVMRAMGSYDTEQHVADCIDLLVQLGIFDVEPDGCAIMKATDLRRCLDLRRSAAPKNGRLGGRPRAGETPIEARARRAADAMSIDVVDHTSVQEIDSDSPSNAKPDAETKKTKPKTKTHTNSVSGKSMSATVVVDESNLKQQQQTTTDELEADVEIAGGDQFAKSRRGLGHKIKELAALADSLCPRWSPQQREITATVISDLLMGNYSESDIRTAIEKSAATSGPNVLRKIIRRSSISHISQSITPRALPNSPEIDNYDPWKVLALQERVTLPKLVEILRQSEHIDRNETITNLKKFKAINSTAWDHATQRWSWLTDTVNWVEEYGDPWPIPADFLAVQANVVGSTPTELAILSASTGPCSRLPVPA